jgi:hypothetical protein
MVTMPPMSRGPRWMLTASLMWAIFAVTYSVEQGLAWFAIGNGCILGWSATWLYLGRER